MVLHALSLRSLIGLLASGEVSMDLRVSSLTRARGAADSLGATLKKPSCATGNFSVHFWKMKKERAFPFCALRSIDE